MGRRLRQQRSFLFRTNQKHTYDDGEAVFSDLLAADGTPYAQSKGLARRTFGPGFVWPFRVSDRAHENSADKTALAGRSGVCWWLRPDRDYTGRLVTESGVSKKEHFRAETAARRDTGARPVLWFSA